MNTPMCRHCGSPLTCSVVDLGLSPLANNYLAPDAPEGADTAFELHARLCTTCCLVQVQEAVSPDEIFSDYAYFSSYSESWLEHARVFADHSIARFNIASGDQVVEIASNDGYLLRNYVDRGIDVLGVEPAANVAEVAVAQGIRTEVAFFGDELAAELLARGRRPKLIVGNNVFAHVPDINDFAAGLARLAGESGVVVLEFPHLARLLAETQFDTIYHEHFSYLSLAATENILGAAGLSVFDVEQLATHGGSLRIYAGAKGRNAEMPAVEELRVAEKDAGTADPATFEAFVQRVQIIRRDFRAFLSDARVGGYTVAAYGAAAKGNTLLNYCGVESTDIVLVADLNPHKQGLLMPGSRIPIVAPEQLVALRPDFVIVLPWNLRREIVNQLDVIRDWGGRFVTAVPELRIEP